MVAIDNDRNSQQAVRWAVENCKLKHKLAIVHVNIHNGGNFSSQDRASAPDYETQKLFIPYRGYCSRKGITAKEIVLHASDIGKALGEYMHAHSVTTAVFGSPTRSPILRAFKSADTPTLAARYSPENCSVYVVSKLKTVKLKTGIVSSKPRTPPDASKSKTTSFFSQDNVHSAPESSSFTGSDSQRRHSSMSLSSQNSREHLRGHFGSATTSPQNSVAGSEYRLASKFPSPAESTNTSFESIPISSSTFSSPLHSVTGDSGFGAMNPYNRHHGPKMSTTAKSVKHIRFSVSGSSDHSDRQSFHSDSVELIDQPRLSESSRSSTSSQTADFDDEVKRLKLELAQVTEKYSAACQESENAREKLLRPEEGSKEQTALALADKEREKSQLAIKLANKSQRLAELEAEKRKHMEKKFKIEVAAERQKAVNALTQSANQYRKYSIDEIERATNYFSNSEKVGEGGYGPVYKAVLDHTAVAIKVLRPDIAEGHTQFQREIEVLSRMRHPNMVILLGACPEYGCLIYEYMDNGSLEDRLYCRNGTRPLSWPTRFRIAAEIATALNFLHQTKPEPLVHRDLKPANILLDKNYVTKISDVGLSRLVPPSVADSVTQYHMTAAAGTFCYIDPEYQQTGMLGTKSDIYSLGVLMLQIITAKPAMGLTYHVENAIECGQFQEVLDPTVKDWPVEEALSFAKLALRCCELRKRDRPNLNTVILPELDRLKGIGSKAISQDRYDYMPSSGQRFETNSSLSQESRRSTLEMQMENHSKYYSGIRSTFTP